MSYLVRQRLEAAKVEIFKAETADMLLIRYQARGFCTGSGQYRSDILSCFTNLLLFKWRFRANCRLCHQTRERALGFRCKMELLTIVYKHSLIGGMIDN